MIDYEKIAREQRALLEQHRKIRKQHLTVLIISGISLLLGMGIILRLILHGGVS